MLCLELVLSLLKFFDALGLSHFCLGFKNTFLSSLIIFLELLQAKLDSIKLGFILMVMSSCTVYMQSTIHWVRGWGHRLMQELLIVGSRLIYPQLSAIEEGIFHLHRCIRSFWGLWKG